ncbi:Integrase [Pseudomonas reidholzensis]|uniref:Integrase n=1 Tax=Pseudomonas reidholzensis TaxID=1785162 RepID=A0A383RVP5_9PSED|nr:Integrase [Pseudomonas reidholzensis]
MAGKPMDLPPGIDVHYGSLRLRFMWEGSRRSETLPYPPTQKGIKAASQLRDQVTSLIKFNLLDHDKYAELFPSSAAVVGGVPTFGEYAQLWLDSREITAGTRLNYKGTPNLYWVPHLALVRIDLITTTLLRRIVAAMDWTSSSVKRNAMVKLSTILRAAVLDGLITRNPAEAIQLPARAADDRAGDS